MLNGGQIVCKPRSLSCCTPYWLGGRGGLGEGGRETLDGVSKRVVKKIIEEERERDKKRKREPSSRKVERISREPEKGRKTERWKIMVSEGAKGQRKGSTRVIKENRGNTVSLCTRKKLPFPPGVGVLEME